MTLGEKQELFVRLEVKLLAKALELGDRDGFTVRGGDAFRDPRVHGIYGEKRGYGATFSLHKLKLARDLNFVKDGRLLDKSEDFEELGTWWCQQHELCRWGGPFGDGNHFSVTHDGRW